MPYVFGAAGGDDINSTRNLSSWANNSRQLVMGWFYPTTLTATRTLFSMGNNHRVAIDTVTDELRITTDHATTDGVRTTTGVDLVVNQWTFLAVMITITGGADSMTIWAASTDTFRTVTNANVTIPSGTGTGATALTVGNAGTNTLAFQGEIADIVFISQSGGVPGLLSSYTVASGSGDTNGDTMLFNRVIHPYWRGDAPELMDQRSGISGEDTHLTLQSTYMERVRCNATSGQVTPAAVTVNGATPTLTRHPRPDSRPFLTDGILNLCRRR